MNAAVLGTAYATVLIVGSVALALAKDTGDKIIIVAAVGLFFVMLR